MKRARVLVTDDQKKVKIPTGLRLLLRRCCNAVLEIEKFEKKAVLDISFVDNEKIKEFNKKYRNKDLITDVLSFPMSSNGKWEKNPENDEVLLGDVVISLETALEQADKYGHSFEREISYLTVHSLLHLLGYNHENGGIEKLHMREKEEFVMSKLGLNKNCKYIVDGFITKKNEN